MSTVMNEQAASNCSTEKPASNCSTEMPVSSCSTEKVASIVLTEKAAGKVKEIIQEGQASESLPGGKLYLRLRVVGGGCSGFQHKLDLDPDVTEGRDEVFEIHGVPVVIDKMSMLYLNGAHVDFHDELHRSGFSITNPSARSTCGCGSSFSM